MGNGADTLPPSDRAAKASPGGYVTACIFYATLSGGCSRSVWQYAPARRCLCVGAEHLPPAVSADSQNMRRLCADADAHIPAISQTTHRPPMKHMYTTGYILWHILVSDEWRRECFLSLRLVDGDVGLSSGSTR
jgi:hypothetical protein